MTPDRNESSQPLRPRAKDVTVASVRHVRERLKGPVHQRLSLALQAVLLIGMALAVWQQQWLTAVTTGAILAVTILPLALGRRFAVFVPPEFEALTIVFVFASLFLGEVGGYYTRFWWWDAALHTASGFLLGILGFLLVYVMNEKEELAEPEEVLDIVVRHRAAELDLQGQDPAVRSLDNQVHPVPPTLGPEVLDLGLRSLSVDARGERDERLEQMAEQGTIARHGGSALAGVAVSSWR